MVLTVPDAMIADQQARFSSALSTPSTPHSPSASRRASPSSFRRAGRFGAAQAVTIELAVMVAAAAFYALPFPVAVATAAAALLVAVVLLIRVGRRWWYEAVAARLRMRRRRRVGSHAARAARTAGPYRAEFAALAPYLAIHPVNDRRTSFGVGTDELGWFAAIAVTPPDALSSPVLGPGLGPFPGGGAAALRLDWLARMVAEPSAVPTAVQVVVRHTPLPHAVIDPLSLCALSYQELRSMLAVPSQRDVWVAVRLGLDDGLLAAEGGDLGGIHRALAAALSRIGAMLTTLGLDHRVLDAAELRQALIGAYGPDPYDGRPVRIPPARESWSRWRSVRAVHVCFAVGGSPSRLTPDLLAELAHVPGAVSVSTAVSFVAASPDDRASARMVIRVVAAPDAVTACLRQLRAGARNLGLSLVRLDGEQAAAVYATTPTAVPAGPAW
jgi:type VII secretion protein EccE